MSEEKPMPDRMDDISAWRKSERARLIAQRQVMPIDAFRAVSDAIVRRLPKILPSADITAFYWPFRREPDCLPLMRSMLNQGARVALPIVVGRGSPLAFRLWTEKAKMEAGPWEILHPAEGPFVMPTAFVVPLVGFDDAGYRLGYGAGYYDRTLASLAPRPFTVGVGFEFSRLQTIHPQPHDVPLDVVVTEERVRSFPER
jgi:5-formyltetrahydrofolate cyclo-ligase